MRKRRERRKNVGSEAELRHQQPSVPAEAPRSLSLSRLLPLLALGALLLLLISYQSFRGPKTISSPSTHLSVYERGLVKPNVGYQEVLNENSKASENVSDRHFKHPVLAYVTPWNSKGYDVAKKFNSKFTHVSPVWYELRSEGSKLSLVGQHNADTGWVSEVKSNGHTLVLPRVVLEAFPNELLKRKMMWEKAINLILAECEAMGYDGVVLESWSRWAAYGVLHDPNMRSLALQFINQLADKLHSTHSMQDKSRVLQLVYVIPAPRSEVFQPDDFTSEDLRRLSEAVDWFSLMTYDFSSAQYPGPSAPLNWIRSSLKLLLHGGTSQQKLAHKILIGINFYGNDFIISEEFGGGPIIGSEYLALLEKHRPAVRWNSDVAEHFFVYPDDRNYQHAVFYPSLMSISTRLEEAHSWGAGLSIWEIGQGLDYFFDLL
ncbi:Chitinase domain-containing protein 1 [Nymphaea thermarum]|nr:Chitinase domain-containing protein 1 [Nymphaea thermarum]